MKETVKETFKSIDFMRTVLNAIYDIQKSGQVNEHDFDKIIYYRNCLK
jgi:hypothetical protein